jgi:hypothetical protein
LTAPAWTCPDCKAPFANRDASHSCVVVDLDRHFDKARPGVREAFDRLVEIASVDGPIPVVAQKTRIVFASPMRFLAIQVPRDRLRGHVLHDRAVQHPVMTEIVPNAYESGLYLHRFSVASPDELDDAFAAFIREAAQRVGRRGRFAAKPRSPGDGTTASRRRAAQTTGSPLSTQSQPRR